MASTRIAQALARLEVTETEVEEWAAAQRAAADAETSAYKRRAVAQRDEMDAALVVHAERREALDGLTQSALCSGAAQRRGAHRSPRPHPSFSRDAPYHFLSLPLRRSH